MELLIMLPSPASCSNIPLTSARNQDKPPEKSRKVNEHITYYILISAGMIFRNKKKFRFGIPAYTGPFRASKMCIPTQTAFIVPT
jgi:hypothetical protein